MTLICDTADLVAQAGTNPRVRQALDQLAERVMHDQGDVLRGSIDMLT